MTRQGYTDQYVRINRKLETKWFPKVHKALKSKVSSLIEVVESSGVQAGIKHLNESLTNPALSKAVNGLYENVGLTHARLAERRLRNEVLKGFGDTELWRRFINEFLAKFLFDKITFKVNEYSHEYLLNALQESVDNGWSVTETIEHLEQLPHTRSQAARIVRTEVNRAANTGVYAQGEFFKYELVKEWISVRDVRTRGVDREDHADHYRMDGQTVDYYATFRDPKNGHELRFPGDPEAQAEDTINCRCHMMTLPKKDENDNLIPKKTRVSVIRPSEIIRPRTITI
jgi:hypothetical protein